MAGSYFASKISDVTLLKRFRTVVPKLFRAFTQIEVAIRSYYPQYFAVIAHNIEQNCSFGSALPPEGSHITPGGNLPPVSEPLI